MKKNTPKRLIASMLAIIFIISAFAAATVTANAWNNNEWTQGYYGIHYTNDNWGYYLDNKNNPCICDYTGNDTTITVPAKINGQYIYEISLPSSCKIKHLSVPHIPELIIGEKYLGYMENLETVTFSRDYTDVNTSPRISVNAFQNSKKLKSVILPNLARGRTRASKDSLCDTFAGCSQLEEVVFPDNTKKFECAGYDGAADNMLGYKDPDVDHFFISEGVEDMGNSFGAFNADKCIEMQNLKVVLPSTVTRINTSNIMLSTIICPTLDVKKVVMKSSNIWASDNEDATEDTMYRTHENFDLPTKMATLKVINIDTTLKKLFGDKEYFDKLTADNLVSYKIYDTDNNFVMDYPLEKTSTSIINMYKTLTTGANYNLVLTDKNGDEYTRMFTYYLDGVVPVNETINNTNFETTINTLFDGINTDTITSVKVCDALSDTELAQLNADGTFTNELESDTVYKLVVTDIDNNVQETYFKLEDGQLITTDKPEPPVTYDTSPRISPNEITLDSNTQFVELNTTNTIRNGLTTVNWGVIYNGKTYTSNEAQWSINYNLPVWLSCQTATCYNVAPVHKGEADVFATLSNGQKVYCHVVVNSDTQEYLNWLNAQQTEPTDPATSETEPVTSETNPDPSAPSDNPTEPTNPAPKLNKTKASLKAGGTVALKVTDGTVKTWTTSNKKVATVSKGKVTALKKGSVTITAKLTTGKKLKCKVTVKTSPKLSKKSVTVNKGKTVSVKITGKAKKVKNAYTNTKVAKIISKKTATTIKVKGLKKGKTTLKIKVNGVVLKLKVKVIN